MVYNQLIQIIMGLVSMEGEYCIPMCTVCVLCVLLAREDPFAARELP